MFGSLSLWFATKTGLSWNQRLFSFQCVHTTRTTYDATITYYTVLILLMCILWATIWTNQPGSSKRKEEREKHPVLFSLLRFTTLLIFCPIRFCFQQHLLYARVKSFFLGKFYLDWTGRLVKRIAPSQDRWISMTAFQPFWSLNNPASVR